MLTFVDFVCFLLPCDRFVKGVVDSEDLPLSLSREKAQDSSLLRRIRDVITRKMIRFFEEQARDEPQKFREFYMEYNYFLKEGICHDYNFVEQISKLLLFESSAKAEGEMISFDDYISRCPPEQKNIYYIVAPSRSAALNSPYYETFKKHNREVLIMFNTIDDFVMQNVKNYAGELTFRVFELTSNNGFMVYGLFILVYRSRIDFCRSLRCRIRQC